MSGIVADAQPLIEEFKRAREWYDKWLKGDCWCFDCSRKLKPGLGPTMLNPGDHIIRRVAGMAVAVCLDCNKINDARYRLGPA